MSIDFAMTEATGRQLMDAERQAQMDILAQRATTNDAYEAARSDMVAAHRRRVDAAVRLSRKAADLKEGQMPRRRQFSYSLNFDLMSSAFH